MAEVEYHASVRGAAFVEATLASWRDLGWSVDHIHSLTEDDYRSARGLLGRVALRWQMYIGQALRSYHAARRTGAEIQVVTTNPFFAPALVQRFAPRETATVNLVYDLYPDALELSGALGRNSLPARLLARTTRYALAECTTSVFLGARLRAHAERRYCAARAAVVIPVGADASPFRRLPPERRPKEAGVEVLYCGQLGRMHDAATIGEVAVSGLPEGVRLQFNANGAGYPTLRQRLAGAERVALGGGLGAKEWLQAMLGSQVSLVTLVPGAERIALPSKTYSALVAGQAILAVCPRDSDLADLVAEHDCGWLVEPGDCAGLRTAMEEMAYDPAELHRRRLNAWTCGHRHYDLSVVSGEWDRLFRGLIKA